MQESIPVLKFVAGHYSFTILIGLVSYILGRGLTKRVSYSSLLEQVSICASLGLGAIAYLVFLLGILGLLYKWFVIVALIACVAATYPVPLRVAQGMLYALRRATLRAW